jgi:hypothetical protein
MKKVIQNQKIEILNNKIDDDKKDKVLLIIIILIKILKNFNRLKKKIKRKLIKQKTKEPKQNY